MGLSSGCANCAGLLERIKHLFDVDGVAFVLLVNREQIESYIRKIYSSEDADSYLLKFGNIFVDLPRTSNRPLNSNEPGRREYCMRLVSHYEITFKSAQDHDLLIRSLNALRDVITTLTADRVQFLNMSQGFTEFEIEKFVKALLKSGKTSVDSFLEHHPEFIPVGKRAIAFSLVKYENESALFRMDAKSWYEYLFNLLNTKFEDFDKNQLSILTFNYDRSLEHYLFTALKNAYPKTAHECAQKFESVPVIHLHGDIGALPGLGVGHARLYNTEISAHILTIATERIRIIHEDVASDPAFERAKTILSKSKIICFLGFGYHEMNLARLGFAESALYTGKAIYGSTFGMTAAERYYIKSKLLKGHFLEKTELAQSSEVLGFLRETGMLLGTI